MTAKVMTTAQRCKIASYQICKASKQIVNIQSYLLKLLQHYPNGLTCNEISKISGIKVQSLTRPLQVLKLDNKLIANSIRYDAETNRHNLIYQLPKRVIV